MEETRHARQGGTDTQTQKPPGAPEAAATCGEAAADCTETTVTCAEATVMYAETAVTCVETEAVCAEAPGIPSAESGAVAVQTVPGFPASMEEEDNRRFRLFQPPPAIPAGYTDRQLYRESFAIAWPALVELILTQLTSMADLMMVGGLGTWAITSVGLTTQPKFLLMTMIMSLNVGTTALIARCKGAGKQDEANAIFRQSIMLTLLLAVFSSVLGYRYAEPLIRFMGAAEDATLIGGTQYFQVQMLGFVPLALTSTITASMRGAGLTRQAMYYNTVSNAVNIVFNWLWIEGHLGFPRLEVYGASLATILGQSVAFVIAVVMVLRGRHYIKLSFRDSFRPNNVLLRRIARVGAPAMLEQGFMRAGMIIFSMTVASLGTTAFATHQICMNIQSLSFMTGTAFATAATTLVGQSLGKKNPPLAAAYCSRCRRLGLYAALFLTVLFAALGRHIVGLYNDEAEVLATGARILLMLALLQPFQSSQLILAGALRGAGDTRFPAMVTFITVLGMRTLLALFLVKVVQLGLYGAWIAMISDQLLRSLLMYLRYIKGKWKTIKI